MRLFAAGGTGHQQRYLPQVQQVEQAPRRQLRVERQVSGACLEAAEHHAQQLKAALCQQRHRLINAHTGPNQGMTEAVGAGVQIAIGPALIQAGRNHLLRVRRRLRFKQAHIAVRQRVIPRGLIAGL